MVICWVACLAPFGSSQVHTHDPEQGQLSSPSSLFSALPACTSKGLACVQDAFLEKHGAKLGFMSAFVKASADALARVPAANGVIDGDEIVYRDYIDISIAVATPKGLVVPVLRNADELSFAGVEKVSRSR